MYVKKKKISDTFLRKKGKITSVIVSCIFLKLNGIRQNVQIKFIIKNRITNNITNLNYFCQILYSFIKF